MAVLDQPVVRTGERIDIAGLSGWASGRFRLGAARGTVRYDAGHDAIGWGPDVIGDAFEGVRVGRAARHGRMAFEIARADLGGTLAARCRYAREETRDTLGIVDLATAARPLRLACRFRLNGGDAGSIDLRATGAAANDTTEHRIGAVMWGDTRLTIRSTHALTGIATSSVAPVGYCIDAADGEPVALVDLSAGTSRRAGVTRASKPRAAASAAVLTVALFRDPGDVG